MVHTELSEMRQEKITELSMLFSDGTFEADENRTGRDIRIPADLR
jgi:hypothetical protein